MSDSTNKENVSEVEELKKRINERFAAFDLFDGNMRHVPEQWKSVAFDIMLDELANKKHIKEPDKEPEKLKPKVIEHGHYIRDDGIISANLLLVNSGALFRSEDSQALEPLARRQQITSVIHRLKQSLGDNHEFEDQKENLYVVFDIDRTKWFILNQALYDSGIIYFETEANAVQVMDYLNEHYPKGWQ